MSDQASEDLDPKARLWSFIVEAGHPRGGRLPPERHLAETLSMSRATLRKALDSLERDGLIWRHVGKGTFVSDGTLPKAPSSALSELGRQLTPFRMMQAVVLQSPRLRSVSTMHPWRTLTGFWRVLAPIALANAISRSCDRVW